MNRRYNQYYSICWQVANHTKVHYPLEDGLLWSREYSSWMQRAGNLISRFEKLSQHYKKNPVRGMDDYMVFALSRAVEFHEFCKSWEPINNEYESFINRVHEFNAYVPNELFVKSFSAKMDLFTGYATHAIDKGLTIDRVEHSLKLADDLLDMQIEHNPSFAVDSQHIRELSADLRASAYIRFSLMGVEKVGQNK